MDSNTQIVFECLSVGIEDLRKRIVTSVNRNSTCPICNRNCLWDPRKIECHFEEPSHLVNEEKLVILLKRYKKILTRILSPRHVSTIDEASAISSQYWKNAVQAGMYRYVIAPDGDDDNNNLLMIALGTLQSFRYHEGFVILALAVWKSECLRRMPMNDFYAAQQWMSGGWKALKTEQQNSNAESTIVSLVRPFVHLNDLSTGN